MSPNAGLGAVLGWGADPLAALGSPGCLRTLWSVFTPYLLQHWLEFPAWSCRVELSAWVMLCPPVKALGARGTALPCAEPRALFGGRSAARWPPAAGVNVDFCAGKWVRVAALSAD